MKKPAEAGLVAGGPEARRLERVPRLEGGILNESQRRIKNKIVKTLADMDKSLLNDTRANFLKAVFSDSIAFWVESASFRFPTAIFHQ